MWQFPWKYKESFAIAFGLFLVGILLQVSAPLQISAPAFPANMVLGLNLLLIPLLFQLFAHDNKIVIWFGSIPAALSAIALFTILSLIMGFIPQNSSNLDSRVDFGFAHVLSSWQYILAESYFFLTLCFVTVKRLIPFKSQNIGFILNHLGLLLVILGIALGMGDKQKILLRLSVNTTEWRGFDENQRVVELPIALKLKSFSIDDFNPTLLLVDNASQMLIEENNQKQQFIIDSGAHIVKQGWTITIKKYLPDASFFNGEFRLFKSRGSVPAAFVEAKSATGEAVNGWISCGNYISPVVTLRLDRKISLAMSMPRPKCYSSQLTIFTQDGQAFDTVIEVNRPVKVMGWKLYQTGFDEKKGKWSDISIVEAVRDPWLPIIYCGFFMLIIGAGFIFWRGRQSQTS